MIISGSQTGVDQGALRAAAALNIPTGGWAPKGWRTEIGPARWLQGLGLKEHESADYRDRTVKNITEADATLIFGRHSVGSDLTLMWCKRLDKPHLWVNKSDQGGILKTRLWLARITPRVLNIAGNRESVAPGIGALVEAFLLSVFK